MTAMQPDAGLPRGFGASTGERMSDAEEPAGKRPDRDDRTEHWVGEPAQDPETVERNIARVQQGFWAKLKRVARKIPFAHDLVAAYYCAMDPTTPLKVRATLLGALGYFVLPLDSVPDFLMGFGYTDDATVLLAAISMVAAHITDRHRETAQDTLAETLELVPENDSQTSATD